MHADECKQHWGNLNKTGGLYPCQYLDCLMVEFCKILNITTGETEYIVHEVFLHYFLQLNMNQSAII